MTCVHGRSAIVVGSRKGKGVDSGLPLIAEREGERISKLVQAVSTGVVVPSAQVNRCRWFTLRLIGFGAMGIGAQLDPLASEGRNKETARRRFRMIVPKPISAPF